MRTDARRVPWAEPPLIDAVSDIPRLPQTQVDLNLQLHVLSVVAGRLGLEDAAAHLRSVLPRELLTSPAPQPGADLPAAGAAALIPQRSSDGSPLSVQLFELHRAGVRLGIYDAADFLRSRITAWSLAPATRRD